MSETTDIKDPRDLTAEDVLVYNDPTTPENLKERTARTIDELEKLIEQNESGSLADSELKPQRLIRGVYGQNQGPPTQMVRIKLPGGILNSEQLRVIGRVTATYPSQRHLGHITTRQDIQVHFIPLNRAPAMLRELNEVGVTTREACGNTIRNTSMDPTAGYNPGDLFSAAPHALEVTRFFLFHPLIQQLPRKFKMSFSSSDADMAMAGMHDLGFIAASEGQNGTTRYGYQIWVGGGLGSQAYEAKLLYSFVPLDELLRVVEGILLVYNRDGERRKRGKARIKYLIKKIGVDEFRQRVDTEIKNLAGRQYPALSEPVLCQPSENKMDFFQAEDEEARYWFRTNVHAAQGVNRVNIKIRVPIGDLNPEQFAALADLTEKYGGDEFRVSQDQNAWFVNIRNDDVNAIYQELKKLNLARGGAHSFNDPIACPGASTCNLAVTASRGLNRAIEKTITQDIVREYGLEEETIHISGCMNSCGQHHLGSLGFYGRTGWSGENNSVATPYYSVLIGGGNLGAGRVALGRQIGKLPAKRIPEFILYFLESYKKRRKEGEGLAKFCRRLADEEAKQIFEAFESTEYKPLDSYDETERVLNIDWGETQEFVKGKAGESECA